MKRPWTADDVATLRRMARAGYSDGEIAAHIGRDRRTVCDVRRRLGLTAGLHPAIAAAMTRINRKRMRFAA